MGLVCIEASESQWSGMVCSQKLLEYWNYIFTDGCFWI